MIKFHFEGFEDLKKDLQAIDFGKQQGVLLKAARAGATVIKEEIEQKAPRDEGTLASSIMITGAGQRNDIHSVRLLIGPSTEAFYGIFLEYGTAFMSPLPFLEPSFQESERQAMEKVVEVLRTQIDKAL